MRTTLEPSETTLPVGRVGRFARFVSLRRPRPRWPRSVSRRTFSSQRRLFHRRAFVSRAAPDAAAGGPKTSLRFRLGDLIRQAIAIIALVGGIILVKNEPEFLLPLLPVEALLVCELVFWNDRAVMRPGGDARANSAGAENSQAAQKQAMR
jgi:hypothetical protein